jgi:hypothetical protein
MDENRACPWRIGLSGCHWQLKKTTAMFEYKANKAHVEYMILAIAPDDIPPRNAQSTQVGG